MPKIRALKPEFWTDEAVVAVQPLARLLFQGLWNYACDNGHVEDKPRQLKMRILPADNCDVDELLSELAGAGLIERAAGWVVVPNLMEHQKPDRRYLLYCDHPGCGDGPGSERAAAGARFGNHRRWHEGRSIVDPGCEFCPIEPPDESELPPENSPETTSGARRVHVVEPMGARRGHVGVDRGPIPDGDGDGDGDGDRDDSEESNHPEKPKRRSPKVPIPADWAPTDKHRAYARDNRIDLDHEAERFRTRALATDERYANWSMAFTNWLSNGKEKGWAKILPLTATERQARAELVEQPFVPFLQLHGRNAT